MKTGETVAEEKKETDPRRQGFPGPVNGQKGKQQGTAEIEEEDHRCPE
jgi:hypothetical protein